MADTIIRGKAVSGADTYKLYKKQDDSSYEEKATSSKLLFDLLAIPDASDGEYVVKAFGTGYIASEYSNPVKYTKPTTSDPGTSDPGTSDPDTPTVPDTPETPDPDPDVPETPEVIIPEDMRGIWQFKDTLTDSFLPLSFTNQTEAEASENINFSINSCVVSSKITKAAVDSQAGDGSAASGNISYEVFGHPTAYTFNKSEGTQGWCGTGKTIEILDNNISEDFKKQICANAEKTPDSTNSTIISFSILDKTAKAISGATWYNYIKTIADIGTLTDTVQLYCGAENEEKTAPVEYYNKDSGTSGFICYTDDDNNSRVLLSTDSLVEGASYKIYDPSTLDLSEALAAGTYYFKNILDDDFCAPGSALNFMFVVNSLAYDGLRRDSETGDLITISRTGNPEIVLYNFNNKTWAVSDEGNKFKRFTFYGGLSTTLNSKFLSNAAKLTQA